jgi:isopenicillin-N epimerase
MEDTLVQKKAPEKGQGTANFSLVDQLINQPEDTYRPPSFPFPIFPESFRQYWLQQTRTDDSNTYPTSPSKEEADTSQKKVPTDTTHQVSDDDDKNYNNNRPKLPFVKFGKEMAKLWKLKVDVVFLNHGSYGAPPKLVLDVLRKWQDHVEEQPCYFLNSQLFPLVAHAVRNLAKFIGADARDVVFVRNATTGVNAVLRSFPFRSGDAVLCLNYVYGAVKKTLDFILGPLGVDIIQLNIEFPISSEQILERLKEILGSENARRIKLAVLDHIISALGMLIPLEPMVSLLHAHNIQVLVDGAHAVGQIPLDMKQLDADYYVSNCHKWMFAGRGCAFLWVKRQHQPFVRPAVITHGYGQGFQSEFIWQATDDYSAFLSSMTAIQFFETIGPSAIMHHNNTLAAWAAHMLAEAWGTEVVVPPASFRAMGLVRIPQSPKFPPTVDAADALHDLLWDNHRIEAMIFPLGTFLMVRISAQVYNRKRHYKLLAQAVLQAIQ